MLKMKKNANTECFNQTYTSNIFHPPAPNYMVCFCSRNLYTIKKTDYNSIFPYNSVSIDLIISEKKLNFNPIN